MCIIKHTYDVAVALCGGGGCSPSVAGFLWVERAVPRPAVGIQRYSATFNTKPQLLGDGERSRPRCTCQEAKEAFAASTVPHEKREGHAALGELQVDALRAQSHLQVAEVHDGVAVLLLQPIGERASAGRRGNVASERGRR